MSLKEITPRQSSFKYNPKVNELCFVSDLKFCYNADKQEFELDQNPYGEPDLIPISNVTSEEDYSILRFDTVYHGEETSFILKSNHNCDKTIYKIISTSDPIDFKKNSNDQDKVEMVFEEGNVSKIYFYKNVDYQLVDSLSVISEENGLRLITQNPWKKSKIVDTYWNDNTWIFEMDGAEHTYKLDAQPFILQTIKKLMD